MKIYPFLFVLFLAFGACQNPAKAPAESQSAAAEGQDSQATLNGDSLAQAYEAHRLEIEGQLGNYQGRAMATDSLRPQVKQKWDSLHFYFAGADLIRVKTYPYAARSARTEEFYFKDGMLFCAVIEDEGLQEASSEGADDKVYYFHAGELIKEVNNSGEAEYSIRASDAERLLQEATEYQALAAGK